MLHQFFCIISKPSVNSNWSYSPERLNSGQNRRLSVLEIWRMTFKNNRALLLCSFKLCASFHSHQWIQTSYSPETLNSGQNRRFIVPRDLEIWRMTLKNNRAPLLSCFKRYASFHSHQWIQTKVTVRKLSIWVKISNFFVQCDLEIWQMTLKNNRAPLLCYFNLCASFRSHWWIQTGVTVWKRPIWVKIDNFFSRVTLKFDGWPWKTIGHLY